jgi:hypothetical protein
MLTEYVDISDIHQSHDKSHTHAHFMDTEHTNKGSSIRQNQDEITRYAVVVKKINASTALARCIRYWPCHIHLVSAIVGANPYRDSIFASVISTGGCIIDKIILTIAVNARNGIADNS